MAYGYDPSGAPVQQEDPEAVGQYGYLQQLLPLMQQSQSSDREAQTQPAAGGGGMTPYDVAVLGKSEEEERKAKLRKHDPLAFALPHHKIINNLGFMQKLQDILPF